VSADLPGEINQIHSDEYRNPQSLPDGAVLVVGSGQSGAQIAEELYQNGRRVYLSVSRAGRVPRRYRGKDANWWHELMGDYERTADQLPSPRAKFASKPMISGKNGGHTLNLHQFARDGVTLLGRIQGVRDHSILLAQDLKANLARADQFAADFAKRIEEFIAENRIDLPEEALPVLTDGYGVQEIPELNLADANITTVIWATGFSFDFSLVQLPVFDNDGYPIQKRGVTHHPGLYFVGLPWLHNAKSGLLFGLAQDAGHIATTIDEEALRYESVRKAPKQEATWGKNETEFAGRARHWWNQWYRRGDGTASGSIGGKGSHHWPQMS
jgi:putative flavoprotein involved in K+ transport